MESELEQDEHPLEAEDDIPEDDDSPEAPISLNTLRQQMDEIAVERLGLAARTETDFSVVIGEEVRGQSDRNIRKLRDTYTRKLQHQLYEYILQKKSLTLREREFLSLYSASLEQDGRNAAKVKRENETPPRKKSGLTEPEN